MSGGSFVTVAYENGAGVFHPIRVQPETLTLSLNSVVNSAPANTPGANLPSAKVSSSKRAIGINARTVRVRTSETAPPIGYKPGSIIALPVLQAATFAAYSKGQTGSYSLNGTAYDVTFVGKTPESIV